ncbi:MAG: hypothetical protein AAF492_18740, partial [Verrucomicrobiota bacterium]
ADVDFIYLDVTNTLIYEQAVLELLKTIRQMRKEGIAAPRVTFVTNAASGKTINRLYDRFYSKPEFEGLWFPWQGRPLIFGQVKDPVLRKGLADYFTIKRSWAWTKAATTPNEWQWLDTWPQDYGWSESPDRPEQIPVSAGSHASNSMGKSYRYRTKSSPPVGPDYLTEKTGHGLFFEEQWHRAHEVDPEVVMITQWNEWIAMRFIKKDQGPLYAGRPPLKDGSWFVDVFTPEFSRDIAPMRGGYTDNYYYQMIGHIRRFKGISAPPERAAPREIQIDGRFDDWEGVPENYRDPLGDTMHRHFRGTDPDTMYTHTYGRNDIRTVRVVESAHKVHFKVATAADLTPHTGDHWMVLLIDTDRKKETGWQGYELAVNRASVSDNESTVARWIDGQWKQSHKVPFAYRGNRLELSLPNDLFPRHAGQGFDFKWTDNVSLEDVDSLFLEGDVAPDRRFNFRY